MKCTKNLDWIQAFIFQLLFWSRIQFLLSGMKNTSDYRCRSALFRREIRLGGMFVMGIVAWEPIRLDSAPKNVASSFFGYELYLSVGNVLLLFAVGTLQMTGHFFYSKFS